MIVESMRDFLDPFHHLPTYPPALPSSRSPNIRFDQWILGRQLCCLELGV